jgi:hypothetical protein
MYSSEYTSGFSGPAASHLAPLTRLVTKTMSDRLLPILNQTRRISRSRLHKLLAHRLLHPSTRGHQALQTDVNREK